MADCRMIAVAIPCQQLIHTAMVKALVQVQGIFLPTFITECSTVPAKRNAAVVGFLKAPHASHLLMLDSDMIPPPDLAIRLLAHDKPIVGALYARRTPPAWLMAGWTTTPEGAPDDRRVRPHTGLKKVHWVGAGALLVSRPVLEAVGAPWFAGLPESEGEGEEVHFERRAQQAGFETWCDTNLIVPHIGAIAVTPGNAGAVEAGLL